jgi:hypothetical protein
MLAATACTDPQTDYLAEYGGSRDVYAIIAGTDDCSVVRALRVRAALDHDRAAGASAEYRWTMGYMVAADQRLSQLGCGAPTR